MCRDWFVVHYVSAQGWCGNDNANKCVKSMVNDDLL